MVQLQIGGGCYKIRLCNDSCGFDNQL